MKEVFKGIDSSLIFQYSTNSDRRFMGAANDYLPNPSDAILLEPGVNLESKGRFVSGPELERQNRMTLNEYYLI